MAELTIDDLGRAERLRLARRMLPIWLRAPPAAARPGVPARARAAALQAARLEGDLATTTTCPTASTSGCSGRRWPTRARATRRRRRRWRRRRRPSTSWSRRSSGSSRACACSTSGCGWGGMVMHAAAEHGVKALGVTLSRNQAEWAQAEIERRGLGGLAEVRHMRLPRRAGVPVRRDQLDRAHRAHRQGQPPVLLRVAAQPAAARGGGCSTTASPSRDTPDKRLDPFIARYVFPDGQLEAVGLIISEMNDAGFEVRHEENLREHYALTLHAWGRNLEEHWDEAVAEVGIGRARVWRLYMAACALGFERDNIQLHQVLGVRLSGHGGSGFPLARLALTPAVRPAGGPPRELVGPLAGGGARAHRGRVRAPGRARLGRQRVPGRRRVRRGRARACCPCRTPSWTRCGGHASTTVRGSPRRPA